MAGWKRRPNFSRKVVSIYTLHQACTSVPVALFSLQPLVFSHLKFFCIKLFWGEKSSLGLLPLSCCLCFIPWPSQFPNGWFSRVSEFPGGLVEMKVLGPHTQKAQCNEEAVFFTSSQEILLELATVSSFSWGLYPVRTCTLFSLWVKAATLWPQFLYRCAVVVSVHSLGAPLTSGPVTSSST